jgi:hypothetical protein
MRQRVQSDLKTWFRLVRPIWLLRAGAPDYHRGLFQHTLSRSELMAALGRKIARGALGRGSVTEHMRGRMATSDRLRRAV